MASAPLTPARNFLKHLSGNYSGVCPWDGPQRLSRGRDSSPVRGRASEAENAIAGLPASEERRRSAAWGHHICHRRSVAKFDPLARFPREIFQHAEKEDVNLHTNQRGLPNVPRQFSASRIGAG